MRPRYHFFKPALHCCNLWFVERRICTLNEHTLLKVQQRVVSSCETHPEHFTTNPKWPSQSQMYNVQAFHQDFPNHKVVMVFVTEYHSPHFAFRSTVNLSSFAPLFQMLYISASCKLTTTKNWGYIEFQILIHLFVEYVRINKLITTNL